MGSKDGKKARHLSIFLIKEDFSDPRIIIKNSQSQFPLPIPGFDYSVLFVKSSNPEPPKWSSLFSPFLAYGQIGLASSICGVLLVKLQERYFAICFGQGGRFILREDVMEERFGLLVTLNSVDRESVKCIDKKSLDSIESQSRVQSNAGASADQFGLDVEQDMLKALVGKPINFFLGNSMTGMDSLSVSVRMDIFDLPELLRMYRVKFQEDLDPRYYDWVNNINVIKAGSPLIAKLDDELVRKLESRETSSIWMSIPEIVPWGMVDGFSYTYGNKTKYSDINLDGYFSCIGTKEVTLERLHSVRVYCLDSGHNYVFKDWSAYKCIYAEIDFDGGKFILSDGCWFKVNSDFVSRTDFAFSNIFKSSLNLPLYRGGGEGLYNKSVSEMYPGTYALLDDSNKIFHGGGKGQVEVCDLLSIDKNLIHVKVYGKSQVFSHLFSQGFVSGQLIQIDSDFRRKIIEKVPPAFKPLFSEHSKPKDQEFTITYAVISDSEGDGLSLPFFSRVNLVNTVKVLNGFGFRVELLKIKVDPSYSMTKIGKPPKNSGN